MFLGKAKKGGAETCTKNVHSVPATEIIANVFKAVFERKAWTVVALHLGLQERAAKHRLAGTREFSIDELRTLLRSEAGIHFLSALMDDARPKWWLGFLANVAAGDARRAIRTQQTKLQEAIDAVETLGGTLARAEAALSVSSADSMRTHPDALRAMARPGHCSMAQAKRGR